ncbi:aldo/keto reductase [Halocatena halophila]|uniref:aldo/keto reductase n=1 Tax=Halocatena halophila TaxID=2814576 RepID=UPI002ED44C04
MEYITASGERIPKIGLGTWQLTGDQCRTVVREALEVGYRHIDTAQMYHNEAAIGDAITESDVDRDELFLTTKLKPGNLDAESVYRSTDESCSRLDTGYLDLLLIHWPEDWIPTRPSLSETLSAMNDLYDEGKIRNIGVSNFGVDRLHSARSYSNAPILTNQVQYHPYWDQTAMIEYCQIHDLMVTAYSPFGTGLALDDPVLEAIGTNYDKSGPQVVLRWLTQQENLITIPKTTSKAHLKANLDVFDISLTDAQMERIHRPSKLRTVKGKIRSLVSR